MKSLFNRFVPLFTAAALFVAALMAVCISTFGTRAALPASPSGSPDVPQSSSPHDHVFHSGELRGVWIPYFSIADGKALAESEFYRRFDEIVSTAKKHGINTLFVHIRSHCDAAYPSEIFPFSPAYRYGGRDPSYDPLAYMVKKSHDAGLEFHAWINPYRISSDSAVIPSDSPCKKWEGTRNVIEYGGGVYLNPASAEARSMIIDGVRELAQNYDIDGVHLDDYFYAFTESGADEEEYGEYVNSVAKGAGVMTLTQWRCANVSALVSGIYAMVKAIDSEMLFGISPQGSAENDIKLGADVYAWCSERGFIDYIAPQIYYNSENEVCPFEQTADEWRSMIKNDGVSYYVGLALYKAGSDSDGGTWETSSDVIASQIEYARKAGADGFILYSFDFLECAQTSREMANYDALIDKSATRR